MGAAGHGPHGLVVGGADLWSKDTSFQWWGLVAVVRLLNGEDVVGGVVGNWLNLRWCILYQICNFAKRRICREKSKFSPDESFLAPTSATLQVNTINCKHSFFSLKTLPKNDPRKIICMWTSFSVLALEMHKYKGFQFSQVMHFVWVLIQLEISRFWNLPQERKKTFAIQTAAIVACELLICAEGKKPRWQSD